MKKSLIITGKDKDAKLKRAVQELADFKHYEILWSRSSAVDASIVALFRAPVYFAACGSSVKTIVLEDVYDPSTVAQIAAWINRPYTIMELKGETVLNPWYILICDEEYNLEFLPLESASFRARFEIINID